MRRSLPLRIGAAAALLLAALVGLVAYEGQARASGREVLLAMQGVDPRSPLSGHFALIQLTDAPAAGCLPGGVAPDDGWLRLVPVGAAHRVAGHVADRAAAEQGGALAVRGGFTCVQTPEGLRAVLDIGIDRFHADQQEAERLERILRAAPPTSEPQAFAIVSVGRDGRARLKGVQVAGQRLELTWF